MGQNPTGSWIVIHHQKGAFPDLFQDLLWGERTLLLLHGTGGNEFDLLNLGRELDPDASLLSPRGQVLENGIPRYFRRLQEGVFAEEDLAYRTEQLDQFIEAATGTHGLERKKMIAVGFSNGANIAGSLLLHNPEALGGAVLFRPMVPFQPEGFSDFQGLPILLLFGASDPIVSETERRALQSLLEKGGARLKVHTHNPGSHGLISQDVQIARGWLQSLTNNPNT